jgi:hypothetical protein
MRYRHCFVIIDSVVTIVNVTLNNIQRTVLSANEVYGNSYHG